MKTNEEILKDLQDLREEMEKMLELLKIHNEKMERFVNKYKKK